MDDKTIKSEKDLMVFIEEMALTEHDIMTEYENAPHKIAQAMLKVGHYLAGKHGISGFQAGGVMWEVIEEWMYSGNKCGLKLVDYDDMLYPQYDYKFDKAISENTWNHLQEQAKEMLATEDACSSVRKHWQSIADGVIPFGYTLYGTCQTQSVPDVNILDMKEKN